MIWQRLNTPTKVGFTLVVIHLALLACGLIFYVLPRAEPEKLLTNAVLSLNAPVYLLLYYAPDFFEAVRKFESQFLVFALFVVSPAWLFLAGSTVTAAFQRLSTAGRTRIIATTVAVSLVGGLFLASAQLAKTLVDKLWDGCGYAGLPIRFFSDCSWTGLSFSSIDFALNGLFWITIGLVIGLVLHKRLVEVDSA